MSAKAFVYDIVRAHDEPSALEDPKNRKPRGVIHILRDTESVVFEDVNGNVIVVSQCAEGIEVRTQGHQISVAPRSGNVVVVSAS